MRTIYRIKFAWMLWLIGAVATVRADVPAAKDTLSIDQRDFEIVGFSADKTSTKAESVLIKLNIKCMLVSQPKGYLRAALNSVGETSFKSVSAVEIAAGDNSQQLQLNVDKPFPQIIRVLVWIDKDSASGPPHPLASDNIAFDSKVFTTSKEAPVPPAPAR
jgi:hypothetical protein